MDTQTRITKIVIGLLMIVILLLLYAMIQKQEKVETLQSEVSDLREDVISYEEQNDDLIDQVWNLNNELEENHSNEIK